MRRYRTDSGIYADRYDEYAEEMMDDSSESEEIQVGERAQVLGFFDFCRHKEAPGKGDLITHLRTHDWRKVAYYYNGSGQVEVYSGRLQNAYQHAQQLGVGARATTRESGIWSEVGRGRMSGTRPGAGPGGYCICRTCGERVPHSVGVPCYTVICPVCGDMMTRE